MKKSKLILIMMTSMLLANQENLTMTSNISDEVIKIKLHDLGFCTSKSQISKIKNYVNPETNIQQLENIILEHL